MLALMSVRHPNIAAWSRDPHDGSYSAELGGFSLRVRWAPNTREARGGFAWEMARGGEKPSRAHERFEELEAAMADAEDVAREEVARRSLAVTPRP